MITIFEDYWNKLPDYKDHLVALGKLRQVVGDAHFSLQVDGRLQVKRYVGFFQYGNTRIQILPKVFAKHDPGRIAAEEVDTSLGFVYRLLYWSGYLPIKDLQPQLQNAYDGDLMEVFIGIFIQAFNKLFRQKVHRSYVHQEENQAFIKGKILVSETIRRNPVLRHLHYTRYDEYSLNNPLNQVFKALILELLRKTKESANKKRLVIGLTFLQDVDLVALSEQQFRQVQFNRLNTEFEPLFNFAKLFFQHQQPGLGRGEERSLCFLVRMNILFEKFVGKALAGLNNNELRFQYHQPQWYLDDANKTFQLEPDFTVFSESKCLWLLDAKYKYPFDDSQKVKIGVGDLYQLSTYALRYDCNNLVVIYPKFIGAPKSEVILAEYTLTSGIGPIRLKLLQVDIMAMALRRVVEELRAGIGLESSS